MEIIEPLVLLLYRDAPGERAPQREQIRGSGDYVGRRARVNLLDSPFPAAQE